MTTACHAHLQVDRSVPGELETAVDGVDLLVDVIAYSLDDGRQLAALSGRVGSLIVISSAAVYGMTARPRPIVETDATVEPGDADYATRKRAIDKRRVVVLARRGARVFKPSQLATSRSLLQPPPACLVLGC